MIGIALLTVITSMCAQEEAIIYVGDPMCSWCYGVSEELQVLKESNPQLPFEIIVGGLRDGGGEEWNQAFKQFLHEHWEEIGHQTGMKFSYDLLEKDEFDYNTEPACRAVVVAMDLDKRLAFSFFKRTQKKFYFDNEDPKDVDFYKSICEGLGMSFITFSNKFNSEESKRKTKTEFLKAQQLGISSFPTVLLRKNGEYYLIAAGFTRSDDMQRTLDKYLQNLD